MSWRRAAGPALVALAAVSAVGVPAAPQVFRDRVDLVSLPVIVTGRDGQIVRGLKPENFEIREDGEPQRILSFAEGASGHPPPLHLGLLLDTSESMQNDLEVASEAAIRFARALDEARDVTLVDFDTAIRIGRFGPSDLPRLFERIRDRHAGGATALYDAVGLYVQGTLDRDGQHVLLLYTDGGDTTSAMTFGRLDELLRYAHVMVYAVGYLDHQPRGDRIAQQLRVRQIAHDTGGQAFFPTSKNDIDEIYAKILDELVSRYTIGYTSTNPRADGKFRKVEVRLVGPDVDHATLRTRPGYYAPATPGR